jgi:hypothetical protein
VASVREARERIFEVLDAIQEDDGLPIRFLLIVDAAGAGEKRGFMYFSGQRGGGGLTPWDEKGLLVHALDHARS